MICSAAPDREAAYPDEDSEASLRGTLIHKVLESRFDENVEAPEADAEGIQMVDQCVDYALRRQEELKPAAIRPESTVDPGAYIGRTDCKGTGDLMIISNTCLEIIDLKTGGWLVDPDESQLRLYAVGALHQYMTPEGNVPFDTVRLTVFQPKRPGLTSVERFIDYTPQDLFTWAGTAFLDAAKATDIGVATPDEDACKFCKARNDCKERAEAITDQLGVLTEGAGSDAEVMDVLLSTDSVDKLTPEQLSKLLDVAPLIRARLKDAEDHAVQNIKDHIPIPNYKLVRGSSDRAWGADAEEIEKKLKNIKLKKGEIYKETLRSPAQLQKLGLPVKKWQSIERLIVKPEGKLTLVSASDKREDAFPILDFKPLETEPTEAPGGTDSAVPSFLT